MKKNIIAAAICFFIILLLLSSYKLLTVHPFNCSSVKNDIDYISNPQFKGRLSGTIENTEICEYIKKQFIKNGLKPYPDTYLEGFKVKYPKQTQGKPLLSISSKNSKSLKEYKYAQDYKEDMLNFKDSKITFSKNDIKKKSSDELVIFKSNNYYVFYAPKNNKLDFRSSFISTSNIAMAVMVTKNCLDDMLSNLNNGNIVSCSMPYEVKDCLIYNVVGCIKGRNTKLPPLILSAHFDHVGCDLNGTVYQGALDNASGISFVLEMSKYIKSLGKPQRTIIFAAFNAEEFGCLGSKYFVEHNYPLIKGSKVINFDMIGSDNGVPLCIMGSKKDTADTPFIHTTAKIMNKKHIYFNYLFEDASDHEFFRKNGIDAVTFSDNDDTKIHTPMDKSSFIKISAIKRAFNVTNAEVISCCYNDNIFCTYYLQIMAVSFAGIIILCVIYRKQK